MLRKITSVLTAAVLATGISIVVAPSANASATDATLSAASTIKGVTVVSLGTPGTNPNNIGARGSVHISTSAAADTSNSGSFITNFVTSNSGATKIYVWKHASGQSILSSSNYNGTAAVSDGDVFSIYVRASGGSTYLLYAITVQVSANGSSGSSGSSSTNDAAQAAALEAERVRQVAIAAAKVVLQGLLKGDKPGTIAQYKEADFTVSSEAALARVNAALLKLPADLRVKNEEIAKVVKIENLVDQISTTATQKKVTVTQLISTGFLAKENNNKSILTYLLKNRDASSLGSKENIAAVIAEETEAIKARAARLAAIKAKIAARNK
jgi:hypothetical protein